MSNDILWLKQDADGVLYDEAIDTHVIMFPLDECEYIRLPRELGSTEHRVLESTQMPCAQCSEHRLTLTHKLDNGMYVSICHLHTNPYAFWRYK